MYTWMVNYLGDVQIYEGNVPEYKMYEYMGIEEAILHTENPYRFAMNYFNQPYDIKRDYETCKYYIENEHADTFFICIGSPTWYAGASGCTNVELSDFLD